MFRVSLDRAIFFSFVSIPKIKSCFQKHLHQSKVYGREQCCQRQHSKFVDIRKKVFPKYCCRVFACLVVSISVAMFSISGVSVTPVTKRKTGTGVFKLGLFTRP